LSSVPLAIHQPRADNTGGDESREEADSDGRPRRRRPLSSFAAVTARFSADLHDARFSADLVPNDGWAWLPTPSPRAPRNARRRHNHGSCPLLYPQGVAPPRPGGRAQDLCRAEAPRLLAWGAGEQHWPRWVRRLGGLML
jgi:hypothetical protein